MNAILLLAAVMAGQFKGAPPVSSPAVPARTVPAPRHAIATYKIRHDGLTFRVRGYYRPDIKRIVWNEDDEFNQGSHSMALVTQATFGDEQEGTPLVVRPLIASRPATGMLNEPVMQSRMPNNLRK